MFETNSFFFETFFSQTNSFWETYPFLKTYPYSSKLTPFSPKLTFFFRNLFFSKLFLFKKTLFFSNFFSKIVILFSIFLFFFLEKTFFFSACDLRTFFLNFFFSKLFFLKTLFPIFSNFFLSGTRRPDVHARQGCIKSNSQNQTNWYLFKLEPDSTRFSQDQTEKGQTPKGNRQPSQATHCLVNKIHSTFRHFIPNGPPSGIDAQQWLTQTRAEDRSELQNNCSKRVRNVLSRDLRRCRLTQFLVRASVARRRQV